MIVAANPSVTLGYFQYALSAGAVPLATASGGALPTVDANNNPPTCVYITAEAAGFRWRDDGTNPTAAVGMPVANGSTLFYDGSDLSKLRLIGQTTAAVLNIQFYG
jgi:hypothetical protein